MNSTVKQRMNVGNDALFESDVAYSRMSPIKLLRHDRAQKGTQHGHVDINDQETCDLEKTNNEGASACGQSPFQRDNHRRTSSMLPSKVNQRYSNIKRRESPLRHNYPLDHPLRDLAMNEFDEYNDMELKGDSIEHEEEAFNGMNIQSNFSQSGFNHN